MEKVKSLRELTESEFKKLKEAGLLKIIYPDAPKTYKEIKGTRPKQIENPDFDKLKKYCEDYLDYLEGKTSLKDCQHYIYEIAMTCLYGREVWDFINKQK